MGDRRIVVFAFEPFFEGPCYFVLVFDDQDSQRRFASEPQHIRTGPR
jgi:hypothetical protein